MAVRLRLLREHGQIGKALKPSMDARPTRLRTSSLRVRPQPGQRFALFKNAPGVFVHGVGRFPPLPVFPAP